MNKQCLYCLKIFFCIFNKKRHEKICFKLQVKNRLHFYICGKAFVSVQKRIKHEHECKNVVAHVLQDLKNIKCEKCHQTFASKQKCKQHCFNKILTKRVLMQTNVKFA